MTLSPFTIYLWGIADRLSDTLSFVTFLSGLFAAFATIAHVAVCGDKYVTDAAKSAIRVTRNVTSAACGVGMLLFVAVPDSKTIAVMVIAPAIVNSQPIQQDLPELYNIAVEALKENLKPGKVEKE